MYNVYGWTDIMEKVFDKISSYNLLNNLIPGTLFAFILESISNISIIQENVFVGIVLYYLIGLVISRFGSICIEPILKKINFISRSDYGAFIKVSQNDTKIEILSETNNMYRTLASAFILFLLIFLYGFFDPRLGIHSDIRIICLFFLLAILFLFSYKKQSEFIKSRVESQVKNSKK